MEAKEFIITIQWGKGMHYIAATLSNEARVEGELKYHRDRTARVKAASKRGAKPTVMAWKRIIEK